jgi:hypothetical protein
MTMPDPTRDLFNPNELRQAVADSRTAGQRAVDLIELVVERHATELHLTGDALAEMSARVDHIVRRWLAAEVAAGTLVEHDGRYYGGPQHRADLLDEVSRSATAVSTALAALAGAWAAAQVDDDPLLRTQLRDAYPFNDGLEQIAGKVRFWVDNVRDGVDAAVNEPRACALAIRQHLRTLQPRLEEDFAEWSDNASDHTKTKYDDAGDGLSAFYEASIRNGLGGVFGDVAASASPAFLAMVANLLDAVVSNGDPELEALAEKIAAAYRSSRSRDDERTY